MAEIKKKTKTETEDAQDPALMNAAIHFSVALLTRHGVLKPTQVQINEAADAALLYAKTIVAKVRGQ